MNTVLVVAVEKKKKKPKKTYIARLLSLTRELPQRKK
jgi:hypothetical protein